MLFDFPIPDGDDLLNFLFIGSIEESEEDEMEKNEEDIEENEEEVKD